MIRNILMKTSLLRFFAAVLLFAFPANAAEKNVPGIGDNLPAFSISSPASGEEKKYLGLSENSERFTLKQVDAKLIFVEIVGVYCPQCHIQFPKVNKLFHQIKKDPELSSRVKILAIAAGGNPNEIAFLKEQFKLPYPVLADQDFEIHKVLGEPRTPYNLLVTNGKDIVHAHMGVISDMDDLLLRLRKHSR